MPLKQPGRAFWPAEVCINGVQMHARWRDCSIGSQASPLPSPVCAAHANHEYSDESSSELFAYEDSSYEDSTAVETAFPIPVDEAAALRQFPYCACLDYRCGTSPFRLVSTTRTVGSQLTSLCYTFTFVSNSGRGQASSDVDTGSIICNGQGGVSKHGSCCWVKVRCWC